MISIIFNSYNPTESHERFTRLMVESALTNTKEPLELIAINKKNSPQFLIYLKDSGAKILDGIDNDKGYSYAMNRGSEVAQGEYLTFCDNDIVFGHHWDKQIIKRLNEDLVAASPNSNTVGNYDYPYGFFVPQNGFNDNDYQRFIEHSKNLLEVEDDDMGFAGECIVVRKDVAEKIKWDEKYIYGGNDWSLEMQLVENALPGIRVLYGSNIFHFGHALSNKPPISIKNYGFRSEAEYKYLLPRNYSRDLNVN